MKDRKRYPGIIGRIKRGRFLFACHGALKVCFCGAYRNLCGISINCPVFAEKLCYTKVKSWSGAGFKVDCLTKKPVNIIMLLCDYKRKPTGNA